MPEAHEYLMVANEAHHIMVENALYPCIPKPVWLIVLLCLGTIATVLCLRLSRLQRLSTLLSLQEAELKQPCTFLSEMCKIDSPFLAEQVAMIDAMTAHSPGLFEVAFVNATTFI